jgi:hypothetical protein
VAGSNTAPYQVIRGCGHTSLSPPRPPVICSRVDTKVDFSISRNSKFYAKLNFISRNFVQKISQILLKYFAKFRKKAFCEFSYSNFAKYGCEISAKFREIK